jgi:hypothetical protein
MSKEKSTLRTSFTFNPTIETVAKIVKLARPSEAERQRRDDLMK